MKHILIVNANIFIAFLHISGTLSKMRRRHTVLSFLLFAFFVALWAWQQFSTSSQTNTPSPTSAVTSVLGTTATGASAGNCHERNGLPDPICTPGSTNPRVTQANIYATICVKGYTKTIRPSLSYTENLKRQQIAAYGYTDTRLHDYEEDHLIPLELGGNPSDPKNLWPEPGASPNAKDSIENLCNEKICAGQISLSQAQKEIATNWQTACQ